MTSFKITQIVLWIDMNSLQVTVYNNHRVLAVLLHSHLNCESQVLSCILNLSKFTHKIIMALMIYRN